MVHLMVKILLQDLIVYRISHHLKFKMITPNTILEKFNTDKLIIPFNSA